MTDNRGITANYSYDALNRLTSVSYPDAPTENITYEYDSSADGNHGIGRLTRIIGHSGTIDYHYDHRGNLLRKTIIRDTRTYTTDYSYDLGNNRKSKPHPFAGWFSRQKRLFKFFNAHFPEPRTGVGNQARVPFSIIAGLNSSLLVAKIVLFKASNS